MNDVALLQEYARPTVGVRILEFEHELANHGTVDVELWDTSGDTDQGMNQTNCITIMVP
jgi:hypothetical protein